MQRILCGCVLGCWVVSTPLTGWSQAPMPVPDTGQTTCYSAAGTVIDCPSSGEPFHGQDATYTINPPSYTDLGNGVVRDNVTGLIWEVKTNKDSAPNYDDPRDADNTYTWCDTNPDTNGGDSGTCGDHDTMDFIAALNTARHGGFDDWRMPNFDELRSIVDSGRTDPAINTAFFPNTVTAFYWSSTTCAWYPGNSWFVKFGLGDDSDGTKSLGNHVRAVRGGQPLPEVRYIDHGNGTVTDTVTGLMWQQETALDGEGKTAEMTWQDALSYAEKLTLGSHSDWRLPTIKELSSLVDRNRHNLAINTTFFPNTATPYYWSSTTEADNPSRAWGVVFNRGEDGYGYKSNLNCVRVVRGPSGTITQSLASGPPGTTFLWQGDGFTPNSAGTLHIRKPDGGEYPTQQLPVDGTGHFAIEYTLAASEPPGLYTWWVTDGVIGLNSNEVTFTINAAPAGPNNSIFFPIKGQDGKTGIISID